MEQLITFKLRSMSDCISSSSFLPPRSVRRQLWRTSAPNQPTLCPSDPSKTSSTNSKRLSDKPEIPMKHLRRAPSVHKIYPLIQAPTAPYSRKECKLAVEDIKALYFKGQYKLCAKRCINILDNQSISVSSFHDFLTSRETFLSSQFSAYQQQC